MGEKQLVKSNEIKQQPEKEPMINRPSKINVIRRTKKQTLVIFSTYLITYSCFPSIMIYNELPLVIKTSDDIERKDPEIHEMVRLFDAQVTGLINIGSFYLSLCIGNMITSRNKLVMSNCTVISLVIIEVWTTIVIGIVSLAFFSSENQVLAWMAIAPIVLLGLIHSVLSTHFLALRPPYNKVPLKY